MAFLIPENTPSRSGIPERLRQVVRALRDHASEETTVWLRENDDGVRYLVLLDPGAGILVIEAPLLKTAARRKGLKWRPPGKQDLVAIREEVVGEAEHLRNGIDRAMVRSLPVKPVLAAPNHDEVQVAAIGGSRENVPVLTRSDLSEGRLKPAIRRILGRRDSAPLSEQEEKHARAVINPRVVLSRNNGFGTVPLFQDPEIAPEDIIAVMDREQERVAEHLGWGYRMLRGVAGSGKTLVLTHRVRHLHRLFPNYRILLVCFNRVLANALERMVDPSDQVEVINIDRLAYQLAGPGGGGLPDFEEMRKRAAQRAELLPDSNRYDVVMVDEAQDFGDSGLDLAYSMLKSSRRDLGTSSRSIGPSDAGHFVMALDSAQNIYRRSMTWNPPEVTGRGQVTGRGRTTVFRRNYRNTREILEFAWSFLGGAVDGSSSPAQADGPEGPIPPEAAARSGPRPRILECADLRSEAEALATETQRLMKEGMEVGDIAIMYGHGDLQKRLWSEFQRRGLPYFHVQAKNRKDWKYNQDKALDVRDEVRVSTIHGLKGLEFSRVLIGGVNHVQAHDVPDDEQESAVRRLLYVAMTRAMDELVITFSGYGDTGRALRDARGREGPGQPSAGPKAEDRIRHRKHPTGRGDVRQSRRPSAKPTPARRRPRPAPTAPSEGPDDWPVPYIEWEPEGRVPDPRTADQDDLMDLLAEVAGCEGPVVAIRAYRLINSASGSKRFTKQARGPLNRACARAVREGRLIATNLFDRPGQAHLVLRVPDGAGRIVPRRRGPRRPTEELPPDEIVELMRRLIDLPAPSDSKILKREVLRQLDLVQLTPKVNEFLDRCIDLLDRRPGRRAP